jgi:hypothetical protein
MIFDSSGINNGKFIKDNIISNTATSDNTVSKVCNVANYNGYSEVIIMNLFPYKLPIMNKLGQLNSINLNKYILTNGINRF